MLPKIFGCIQSFTKLKYLKLTRGNVPPVFYHTLLHLPNLTHLSLESCAVPPLPSFFPFSFPSTVEPSVIQVTTLTVSQLRHLHMSHFILDLVNVSIASFFPNLHTLQSDNFGHQLPPTAAAQIVTLKLTLPSNLGDIQPRLAGMLMRMPLLAHVDVTLLPPIGPQPPGFGSQTALSPIPSVPLPHLQTLSAPWPAAGHIVPGAPQLAVLRVTAPIPKVSDALGLLERLREHPLRVASFRLAFWDDEILLAAPRCLPLCDSLEVAYQDGAPSEDFLFNLGIHHLPLLPALHTLRIYALPPPPPPPPPPLLMWEHSEAGAPWLGMEDPIVASSAQRTQPAARTEVAGEEALTDEPDDGPDSATAGEYVYAWARYNPALRRVQLGRAADRTWVRAGTGVRWAVSEVEERGEGKM
ncbi:hypothetical protein C8J57DRAFT_1354534 [Mycena rebaudengoi]|nr:hypothetical protein C8J57DRAFT_1354534 [Mycena rebaudengoi]